MAMTVENPCSVYHSNTAKILMGVAYDRHMLSRPFVNCLFLNYRLFVPFGCNINHRLRQNVHPNRRNQPRAHDICLEYTWICLNVSQEDILRFTLRSSAQLMTSSNIICEDDNLGETNPKLTEVVQISKRLILICFIFHEVGADFSFLMSRPRVVRATTKVMDRWAIHARGSPGRCSMLRLR